MAPAAWSPVSPSVPRCLWAPWLLSAPQETRLSGSQEAFVRNPFDPSQGRPGLSSERIKKQPSSGACPSWPGAGDAWHSQRGCLNKRRFSRTPGATLIKRGPAAWLIFPLLPDTRFPQVDSAPGSRARLETLGGLMIPDKCAGGCRVQKNLLLPPSSIVHEKQTALWGQPGEAAHPTFAGHPSPV